MTVIEIAVAEDRRTIKDHRSAAHGSRLLATATLLLSVIPQQTVAQGVEAGTWDVTSKVVEFSVPGVPGFIARMIRGKSKAEHKRLGAGDGLAVLLAPDPKARCRIDDQRVADGRYAQTLTCPQKQGEPMHIVRAGTYGTGGFSGQAIVTGSTPKGAVRIVLDQRAERVGG